MALDEYQQAYNLLGNSKDILVIAGKRMVEDSYPAALGLKNYLDLNNKKTTLFAAGDIPSSLHFLQDPVAAQKIILNSRQIVISMDTSGKPIKQISYKKTGTCLNIFIIPEDSSQVTEQDIHINMSRFNHDLIVALGVEDLTTLNSCFEENVQFFYETPIINIDQNSANERYGEINIIESLSSSSSEIVAAILKRWDETLITKEIATPLFAGIVAATNNFQNARTKPSALYEAAYLLSREADREMVIKNFFKTKPFELLKLCGIAMSKLNFNTDLALNWTILSKDDFQQSGTDGSAVPLVISEVKNNFAPSSLLVVFWENGNSFRGALHSLHQDKIRLLSMGINGETQGNNIFFDLPSQDPVECEKFIEKISSKLETIKV